MAAEGNGVPSADHAAGASQGPDDLAHAGIGAGRLLGSALCGVFFAPSYPPPRPQKASEKNSV